MMSMHTNADGLIAFFSDPVKHLTEMKAVLEATKAATADHKTIKAANEAASQALEKRATELTLREARVSSQAALDAKEREGLRMRGDALDRRKDDLDAETQAKRATLDGLLAEAQAQRTQLDVAAAAVAERERAVAKLEAGLTALKEEIETRGRSIEGQLAELKEKAERAKALFG